MKLYPEIKHILIETKGQYKRDHIVVSAKENSGIDELRDLILRLEPIDITQTLREMMKEIRILREEVKSIRKLL